MISLENYYHKPQIKDSIFADIDLKENGILLSLWPNIILFLKVNNTHSIVNQFLSTPTPHCKPCLPEVYFLTCSLYQYIECQTSADIMIAAAIIVIMMWK